MKLRLYKLLRNFNLVAIIRFHNSSLIINLLNFYTSQYVTNSIVNNLARYFIILWGLVFFTNTHFKLKNYNFLQLLHLMLKITDKYLNFALVQNVTWRIEELRSFCVNKRCSSKSAKDGASIAGYKIWNNNF